MREIKFRWFGAIDSEDKPRMHSVVGIHWGASVVELYDDEGSTYGTNDKLMQYTGLKDKNGKEIYEGDIWEVETGGHSDKSTRYMFVKDFHIGGVTIDAHGVHVGGLALWANSHIYRDGVGEIIGNIYENPELLNG